MQIKQGKNSCYCILLKYLCSIVSTSCRHVDIALEIDFHNYINYLQSYIIKITKELTQANHCKWIANQEILSPKRI